MPDLARAARYHLPTPAWKRWGFRALLAPITYGPRWWRYGISTAVAALLRHVIKYRRGVIDGNLAVAFPEKSAEERARIRDTFYARFADLIIEQVWAFGADADDIRGMFECGPEIPAYFARHRAAGRPVFVAAGHHNNYELGAAALGLYCGLPMSVIYARLYNIFMDGRVRASRERFGMTMWSRGDVAAEMDAWAAAHGSFAVGFAFDQSPSGGRSKFWMPFFGKTTAVQVGLDRYARRYGAAVCYVAAERVGRGRYRLRLEHVCDDARVLPEGLPVQLATAHLEAAIRRQPEGWFWSHRRWKLNPDDNAIDTDRYLDALPPEALPPGVPTS